MGTLQDFKIQGVDIQLELSDNVFGPSEHGLFLANHVLVNSGESVVDIGTGSGVFAIMASKLGGKAFATDISEESVLVTKKNSLRNNVEVDTRLGPYFADFEQKFDVIIANLPQKLLLGKSRLGVDGGSAGNEVLLRFLEDARKHVFPNSRIYILVYSLTEYKQTLKEISNNYIAKELGRREFLEDEVIKESLERYAQLKQEGTIDIIEKEGCWYAHETAYELSPLPHGLIN